MLRDMFKKTYTKIDIKYSTSEKESDRDNTQEETPEIPAGMWRKCNKCGKPIYVEDVRENFYICPKCGGYFRVHAYRRIEMIADEGSFEEWDKEMEISNPLNFPGYEKKLAAAREKTKLNEAVVTGRATIGGFPAVLGVCDARFLMSSMGHNVGEKITRAIERATAEKLPVILFACSGGARMQEGMISLMQMAKTSAALKRHHDAGQLYVSVFTDPTTGGVTASFAMLGDIILAEPGALIGFAGPRVIEQTIGQKLPEGFQRAEFLLEHGFVDKIVGRQEMKEVLTGILRLHSREECGTVDISLDAGVVCGTAEETGTADAAGNPDGEAVRETGAAGNRDSGIVGEVGTEGNRAGEAAGETGTAWNQAGGAAGQNESAQNPAYGKAGQGEPGTDRSDNTESGWNGIAKASGKTVGAMIRSAWDSVLLSRKSDRLVATDYIDALFDDFMEFHGDRYFGDDGAIVGGIASFHGIPVTVIGQEKGKTTKENIHRNFGMPSPDGYRKALRLMKQAETFGRPIICFVDTPGAFCGIEAEERGQGEAIAKNLMEMSGLKVPVLSIVIGEGGSGGALAMAVANEVWMMENAIYSILSPEGFASILWKDSKRAGEAANVMKITARELKELNLIERVIPEEEPASQETLPQLAEIMDGAIREFMDTWGHMDGEELAARRYDRFRMF